MNELKPCPFCGAKAKVEDHGSFKIVGCSKLSMLCPNPRMAVYNDNFSHWNERIETNSEIALRETLRLKELECQQLAQDKAELVVVLTNVLHAESHNTGREPSLSVFHRAVDEALRLLDKHK